jgi:DNA-binding NarL/FixJ family response regulator
MPVLNGFEVAREIRASLPTTAIVMLSSYCDRAFIEEARNVGVQAYVAKAKAGEELVKAMEAAVRGGGFVLME